MEPHYFIHLRNLSISQASACSHSHSFHLGDDCSSEASNPLADLADFEALADDAVETVDLDVPFNPFTLSSARLLLVAAEVFHHGDLLSILNLSPEKLRRLLEKLQKHYHSNGYHNWAHAVHVLLASYRIIEPLRKHFEPLELLALYLAAICHDVDHPGTPNAVLVEQKHQLALRYSNQSVLERHSIAKSFEILSEEDSDLLSDLTKEEQQQVRELFTDFILATDIGNSNIVKNNSEQWATHSVLISSPQRLNIPASPRSSTPLPRASGAECRRAALRMALLCGDVGVVIEPFDIFFDIVRRLYHENLVSFPNLTPQEFSERQTKFMENYGRNMFGELSRCGAFRESALRLYRQLKCNIRRWRAVPMDQVVRLLPPRKPSTLATAPSAEDTENSHRDELDPSERPPRYLSDDDSDVDRSDGDDSDAEDPVRRLNAASLAPPLVLNMSVRIPRRRSSVLSAASGVSSLGMPLSTGPDSPTSTDPGVSSPAYSAENSPLCGPRSSSPNAARGRGGRGRRSVQASLSSHSSCESLARSTSSDPLELEMCDSDGELVITRSADDLSSSEREPEKERDQQGAVPKRHSAFFGRRTSTTDSASPASPSSPSTFLSPFSALRGGVARKLASSTPTLFQLGNNALSQLKDATLQPLNVSTKPDVKEEREKGSRFRFVMGTSQQTRPSNVS